MLIILYLLLVLVIIPFFLVIISLIQRLLTFQNTNYFDVLNYLSLKMLNVKHIFVGDKTNLIEKGIILSNHRSWFDFPLIII